MKFMKTNFSSIFNANSEIISLEILPWKKVLKEKIIICGKEMHHAIFHSYDEYFYENNNFNVICQKCTHSLTNTNSSSCVSTELN